MSTVCRLPFLQAFFINLVVGFRAKVLIYIVVVVPVNEAIEVAPSGLHKVSLNRLYNAAKLLAVDV